MLHFIRAGGYPIGICIALSIPLLYLAVRLAIRLDARRLAMVRALTWAQIFAVVSGVASDVLAVLWYLGRNLKEIENPLEPLFIGLGEALTPAVLAMSVLTVTWILVAFGLRRTPKSDVE